MKRKTFLLLLLLILVAAASSAWAEGDIQPFYNQTAKISGNLEISGATATCTGKITPTSDATVSSMTMKLQQRKDGSWITIATWSASGAKGKAVSLSKTKNISKGYTWISSGSSSVMINDTEGNYSKNFTVPANKPFYVRLSKTDYTDYYAKGTLTVE